MGPCLSQGLNFPTWVVSLGLVIQKGLGHGRKEMEWGSGNPKEWDPWRGGNEGSQRPFFLGLVPYPVRAPHISPTPRTPVGVGSPGNLSDLPQAQISHPSVPGLCSPDGGVESQKKSPTTQGKFTGGKSSVQAWRLQDLGTRPTRLLQMSRVRQVPHVSISSSVKWRKHTFLMR